MPPEAHHPHPTPYQQQPPPPHGANGGFGATAFGATAFGGAGEGSAWGEPAPTPGCSPALTPSQRMQQRKQAEADRRSIELRNAVSQRGGHGTNAQVAQRLAAQAFSSNLTNGMVERSPNDRNFRADATLRASANAASTSAFPGDTWAGDTQRFGAPPAAVPSPSLQPLPSEPPPYLASNNSSGSGGSGGGCSGSGSGSGGGSIPYSGRAACAGNYSPRDVDGALAETLGGATLNTMRTVMTEQYEDDFEEEVVDEVGDGHDDGTLQLARQQAEARTLAHADAHQKRLAALAYAHLAQPDPAPDSARRVDAAASERAGKQAAGPAQPSGPNNNLGAVRHAALQERCRQALGELFLPVYEYLRVARDPSALADEKEVRTKLQQLVGRERVNDCMCVDELIFTEQMTD